MIKTRDDRVRLRCRILTTLYNAVKILNKGDRTHLSHALKYLTREYRKYGYTVKTNHTFVFDIFGEKYTKDDGMILIKEDNKELMVILKLKSGRCEGEWRLYELDIHDFMYDSDIEAESRAEQEADKAYEKHMEYRAFMASLFDDQRGQ